MIILLDYWNRRNGLEIPGVTVYRDFEAWARAALDAESDPEALPAVLEGADVFVFHRRDAIAASKAPISAAGQLGRERLLWRDELPLLVSLVRWFREARARTDAYSVSLIIARARKIAGV